MEITASSKCPDPNAGRKVLVTGAGGSIGSALARAILAARPRLLLILDSSEHALYEIDAQLTKVSTLHVPVLGDVGDAALMREVFEKNRPETVYHTAAFKQVPLMECHPVEAARNNVLATWTLARLALEFGVSRLVQLSTDKAVRPRSVMGATKRVAERIVLQHPGAGSAARAIRLGNVLESRGSVVPLFKRQIEAGGPVTVSDPEARRYFLSLEDSVALILSVARMASGGLFVPILPPQVRIIDLALELARAAGREDLEFVVTGLRPGDKMSEELLREGESTEATEDPRLLRVKTDVAVQASFKEQLLALAHSVQERDRPGVIRSLKCLVPDYEPSAAVLDVKGPSQGVGPE